MIVEDVRIEKNKTIMGHQLEESIIEYYDVQIKVFDLWWSLVKEPRDWVRLDKALALRDLIKDRIRIEESS